MDRIQGVYSEWSKFLQRMAVTPELREKYIRDEARSGGSDGYFPGDVAEAAKGSKVPYSLNLTVAAAHPLAHPLHLHWTCNE